MIFIGADHAGFDLKESVKAFLAKTKTHQVNDLSPMLVAGDDYPAIAKDVAHEVLQHPGSFGILLCGSGIGMDITANRFADIRASLVKNPQEAELARQHNNANVLVLAGFFLQPDQALAIVETWLATPFSGEERHARRIQQIDQP